MTNVADDLYLPFPIEFLIREVPRSQQSDDARARETWKMRVRGRAAAHARGLRDFYFLDERPVAVTILYFPVGPMQGDVDNIVKPILDGLETVLYPDDRLVERVVVQKFEPGVMPLRTTSDPVLLEAIGATPPVLYIRVDDDLGWRRVP